MRNVGKPVFHTIVKEARKQRGWTQARLAEELGIEPNTVSRWERGEHLPKETWIIEKLCALFEMTPGQLGLLEEKPAVLLSKGQQNQDRARMLRRLHHAYGHLLAHSLQGTVWIDLGLAQKPDAVRNAATLLLRFTKQPERPLPAGTSIMQVFEEAARELLILGEPGAGKSTLLLDLAEQLVEQAEQDETAPLPIILPLSSWAVKRLPLQDWVAEQVTQMYDIPARLAQRWVREEHLLLLLDGLDEMELEARPACIAAINRYHQEHLVPLVVCSRKTEYERAAQEHHLALQSAVVVQPLTMQQVEAYLDLLDRPLAALRQALQENRALQDLARTPLMLNVFVLTYRGTSMESLSRQREQLQQQVWTSYVERMVAQKGDIERYPLHHTCVWLGWLARQMRAHNQTVFYLEHLQADWLAEGRARDWYERLASKGAGIIMGVLVSLLVMMLVASFKLSSVIWYGGMGGLIGGLISGSEASGFQLKGRRSLRLQTWRSLSLRGVCNGVLVGGLVAAAVALWGDPAPPWKDPAFPYARLSYGSFTGLCGALLTLIITSGKRSAKPSVSPGPGRHWWQRVFWPGLQADHLRLGLVVGLLVGLSAGLSEGLSAGLMAGLAEGLRVGLTFAAIAVLLGVLLLGRKSTIELTEILVWSGKSIGRSLVSKHHLSVSGCLVLLGGLAFGLYYLLSAGSIGLSLYGLSIGLAYWLVLGLWNGLSRETLDDHLRTRPNQGITRSIRSALFVGVPAGVICFFVSQLSSLTYDPHISALSNVSDGLPLGCMAALLAALLTGGLASLHHLLLRLHLRRLGVIPRRYVRFLDDAARRGLLYKDGGGYRFIHRLLLDYLADLEAGTPT